MGERGTAGRIVVVALVVLSTVILVAFALYNRGNPIVLEFGFARWRGEAVYALYGAIFVGLLLMFGIGLPADLAARRERRRLQRRVQDLARRADETARPIGPRESAAPVGEPGERDDRDDSEAAAGGSR